MLGTERYGMDRHLYDVPAPTFEYTALVGWAAQMAFIISTCCTKISVLLFYRRLTESTCHKLWKVSDVQGILFRIQLTSDSTSLLEPSSSPSYTDAR